MIYSSTMEESMLDWEMEEEMRSCGGGKVSWIMNKGLVFGKKVLMTGMLITSAPFVLPPLMAISAFGVAASVPSGLFLASYACSEKVMSSLLPGSSPPNSPFLLPGYYFEEEEGDINVGLFEQDRDMDKEEQKQIDDTTARVEMRIELPSDDETLKENKVDHDANRNLARENDDQLQEKIETAHEKASNDDDEFGRNKIIPVEEEVRDVAVMGSTGGHEIRIKEEGELARETIEKIGDKNVDEGSKHDDNTGEEMDMPIEAKSAAAGRKSGGKKKGKKKGKVNELPKQNEEIRNDSVKVDEEATVSTPQTLQHHQGKVQIDDNNNNEGAKAGTRKKMHHSGRLTDQERSPAAGLKKEGVEVDSELEDIRKQIEAMKTIVGYKGTPKPHASCFEELKALYIFTGVVEPPPPESKHSLSDIEQLSHKLKFLMSIVGLK